MCYTGEHRLSTVNVSLSHGNFSQCDFHHCDRTMVRSREKFGFIIMVVSDSKQCLSMIVHS